MEEEVKELKARCLHLEDRLAEVSRTATPTPRPIASENLVSHIRSLKNTIGKSASNKSVFRVLYNFAIITVYKSVTLFTDKLQVEKVASVAALKEKQVRIALLETAVSHALQQVPNCNCSW